MYKKLLLNLSLLLAAFGLNAQLKTADDFFHGGAQLYIHGKKEESKKEIFNGLQFYPADPKLNGMAMLLKKEEEQKQQQQQQQQQNQQDQQQQQQKQDQQQQQQQKQQQQNQKDQQPQKQDQQQQSQAQQQAAEAKEKEDKEKKDAEAYAAGQMTPEQAERLLDAEKGDEKMLNLKPENKPQDRNRPFKDW